MLKIGHPKRGLEFDLVTLIFWQERYEISFSTGIIPKEMHTERLTPFHLQIYFSSRQRADCAMEHVFDQLRHALAHFRQLAFGESFIREECALERAEDSDSVLIDILRRRVGNLFSDGVQDAQHDVEKTGELNQYQDVYTQDQRKRTLQRIRSCFS